jgi:SAM-dependent methyltransferase
LNLPDSPASQPAAPVWQRYLTDWNEGLGVVYERFVLNDYLDSLVDKYAVKTVLEAPLYGMAGVSGINSVRLAQRGCEVTLVDTDETRLAGVEHIWSALRLPVTTMFTANPGRLPFQDASFDLTWAWAALWYLPDPGATLRELARVSRRLVFVATPNRWQVGYLLRRFVIDRPFFRTVDEKWTEMGRIKRGLRAAGCRLAEEGVLDVPPWPDTVMPAAELLGKLGIRSKRLQGQFQGAGWQWSTMEYYLGRQPELRDRVMKYAWLDHARLPWQLKAVWAHHRYVLGVK